METLFTTGTQNSHDDDFTAFLRQHQIDVVVDIRLHNEGRYYRFASGRHIRELCEAHGIVYRHDTRFSPTAEMLDRYRSGLDGPAYERAYRALIAERNMPAIWAHVMASGYRRPCLLCAERTAERCHRRLLAEVLVGPIGRLLHL